MTARTRCINTNVKLSDEQVVRIHQLMNEDDDSIVKIRTIRDKRVTDAGMTISGFRIRANYLKDIGVITR
jgi:hypothetical protein